MEFYCIKYDSVQGILRNCSAESNNGEFSNTEENYGIFKRDPSNIPWGDCELIMCSGPSGFLELLN